MITRTPLIQPSPSSRSLTDQASSRRARGWFGSLRAAASAAVAVLAAFVVTASLLVGLPTAGAASIPALDADAETTLVIHQLEQPADLGLPATGQRQDDPNHVGVAGVRFQVTAVPGIDLTTTAGWDRVEELTVAEARAAIGDAEPTADGTTDARGELVLSGLAARVYLVEETASPAGVQGAAPFLVTLPHPHQGRWLNTVHVYPKNTSVSIDLQVIDENTVTADQPVRWISRSTLPRTHGATVPTYAVTQQLAPGLGLVGGAAGAEISLDCVDCPELRTTDYRVSLDEVDDHQVLTVRFTEAGRAALARVRERHAEAVVVVNYRTTVVEGTGNGTFTTTAGVHLDAASLASTARVLDGAKNVILTAAVRAQPITTTQPATSGAIEDSTSTHFGSLRIEVHERGNEQHKIQGAGFQVYLSAEDALSDRNPLIVDGTDIWVTDENGSVELNGLRFSTIVNGLDRDTEDPLHRMLYVRLVQLPEGWTGDSHVQAVTVHSSVEPVTVIGELWHEGTTPTPDSGQSPAGSTPTTSTGGSGGTDTVDPTPDTAGVDGPGSLPRTGAQILGAMLLAAALLFVGWVLVRRRKHEPAGDAL